MRSPESNRRNHMKNSCAKTKEVDIAALESKAFRYLALKAPKERGLKDSQKGYTISKFPDQAVPQNLKEIIVLDKMVKSQTPRQQQLMAQRTIRTRNAKSRFKEQLKVESSSVDAEQM